MTAPPTGLQTAQDTYTYWSFPGAQYISLQVLTQAVDIGYGKTVGAYGPEAASYPPTDEYVTPGNLLQPIKFDAVRIKNHVPGKAAQYSIAARLSGDLPDTSLGASFTPNYQVINPDGTVGANFSGVINAQGLTIPASGSGSNYSAPNSVQWTRQSDGALVADIFPFTFFDSTNNYNQNINQVEARPTARSDLTQVNISAIGLGSITPPGQPFARSQLRVIQTGSGVSGSVEGNAPGNAFTIMDNTGASTFLQKANNLADLANLPNAWSNLINGQAGLLKPSRAYLGTTITNPAGGSIAFDTVDFDVAGALSAKPIVYTAPANGYYLFVGQASLVTAANATWVEVSIQINGAASRISSQLYVRGTTGDDYQLDSADIVYLTAGQTITLGFGAGGTGTITSINSGTGRTWFAVMRVA